MNRPFSNLSFEIETLDKATSLQFKEHKREFVMLIIRDKKSGYIHQIKVIPQSKVNRILHLVFRSTI